MCSKMCSKNVLKWPTVRHTLFYFELVRSYTFANLSIVLLGFNSQENFQIQVSYKI